MALPSKFKSPEARFFKKEVPALLEDDPSKRLLATRKDSLEEDKEKIVCYTRPLVVVQAA